jgi:hypothetical protein
MTTTILTGLPRSGTTLLCALLNEQANTVALVEPMRFRINDRAEAVRSIHAFAEDTRRSALAGDALSSLVVDGKVVDNLISAPDPNKPGRVRSMVSRAGEIRVDKPLTEDFLLYIKHPAPFTALLEELSSAFPYFALVRHPLAVIASWRSINLPAGDGRVPAAERLDRDLAANLDRQPNASERQVTLVSWFFRKYSKLPAASIVRYEDMIADPMSALSRLHPSPVIATQPKSYRLVERYPGADFADISRRLQRVADDVRLFYPDIDSDLERAAAGDMPF